MHAARRIEDDILCAETLLDGLAGNLLKNEKLATDVSLIASNLSIVSSNLNRLGLWGIMWKKKPAPKGH